MTGKGYRNALPEGIQLLWYCIERVLGQGGFGITYLATDVNLGRKVAIKEYLPSDLAVREGNNTLHPITAEREERYSWGLQRFIMEAQTLAKFNHPNIVRVHNVFEANNTAYMVMEYEQGESFADLLRSGHREQPGLLKLLFALLDGLEHMHGAGFIHRDIKPANIYVRTDGTPVLLDFGSARMALGTHTHNLTGMVSPGYAPYEQYSNDSTLQGPWTDIYGLGATLYFAVADRGPLDAITRGNACMDGKDDPLVPAFELGKGRFTPAFLAAIDEALKIFPQERPQSVSAWRKMLPSPEESKEALDPLPTEMKRRAARTPGTTRVESPQEPGTATVVAVHTRALKRRWPGIAGLIAGIAGAAVLAGTVFLGPKDNTLTEPTAQANLPDGPGHSEQPLGNSNVSGHTDKEFHEFLSLEEEGYNAPVHEPELATGSSEMDHETASRNTSSLPNEDASQLALLDAPHLGEGGSVRRFGQAQGQEAAAQGHIQLEKQRQREQEPERLVMLEAEAKQRRIAHLLTQAEKALRALRLTTPKGDNALAYYSEVQALDPDNARARQGMERIMGQYVAMADTAVGKAEFAKAETYLERADSIGFGSPVLETARERVARHKMETRIQQMPTVHKLLPQAGLAQHRGSSVRSPRSKPKVLILIDEKVMGVFGTTGHEVPNQAELTFAHKFNELGFPVVDAQQVRRNVQTSKGLRHLQGNDRAAAAVGLHNGARLSIFGTAISKQAATKLYGTRMQSIHATLTARVVRNDDARVIASGSASATKAHIDEIQGGALAIEEAARKLAGELAGQVLAKLEQEDQYGVALALNISGLVSYRHLDFIVNYFEKDVGGVDTVNLHSFTAGVADMGLEYQGQTQTLARLIANKQFKGFRLEPTNVSANRMDLAVVLDRR